VRGTQLLVEHMSQVFKQPSLLFIEIGWRWLVGIPILMLASRQAHQILAAYSLDSSGFNSIDSQNPWLAAVQIAAVWNYYAPHIAAVLSWFVPAAALAWVVVSAIGRNLLLRRMESRLRFRPIAFVALQALWVILLAVTFWAWFRAMQWAAAAHISVNGGPDLVGYSIWAIFLTLGFFAGWALISWAFSVAPLIMLLERRSALSALGSSFRLGKAFTSKLAEINLVMGIVKLALMVLAMVFSAAPLPFSDELGPSALHYVTAGSLVFYVLANDYFQVVRVKAFVAFWHIFREPQQRSSAQ
jgi:hypothetical protein